MENISPLRPLSKEEFELLRWMFEHGSEDLRTFEPQLAGIVAARWCDCGCPSIRLEVAEGAPLGRDIGERIIGDFEGKTPRGELVGVLLFQRGGKLELLEVYSWDAQLPRDNSSEWALPTIDSMVSLVWEPSPHNPNIRIPVRSPKSPA
ncbi:MAG: hypothetical protein WBX19_13305 [Terracidiphilus sp.]